MIACATSPPPRKRDLLLSRSGGKKCVAVPTSRLARPAQAFLSNDKKPRFCGHSVDTKQNLARDPRADTYKYLI
jgi:hypothetical protein